MQTLSSPQTQHAINQGAVGAEIALFIFAFIVLILFIAHIFFCISFQKTMKRIPRNALVMPGWLIWLSLIPYAGYVFLWILLPFGMPISIKRYRAQQKELDSKTKLLTTSGFVVVLSVLFIIMGSFISSMGTAASTLQLPTDQATQEINNFFGSLGLYIFFVSILLGLVSYIVYWVKMVLVRKYLPAIPTDNA